MAACGGYHRRGSADRIHLRETDEKTDHDQGFPPIVAIVISLLVTHQLYAINIGTLFALAFQGTIVEIADKVVFPSLKHQNLATKL